MSQDVITDARRRRLLVASVAVAVFMARLDIYVVNISLPTVARHFHVGTSAVSWVTMSYLLLSCGTMMLVGRIADSASPRKLFIWGYAIFTAGSLLCGLSTSLWLLVFFRCVQGLGGAILVIMTYTAVSRFLPRETVGGAMGILATCGALGIAVGSPLGGFLTESLSWRWVFFVNVPIGIVAILVASRSIPSGGGQGGRGARLDYPGAVLSFLAVAAFVLALNVGQERGWASPLIATLFGVSLVCAVLFVVRQTRAADPLIAPALLRDRRFLLANAVCVFGLILMGGNAFLMPFFLELAKGLSTARVGLLLMTYSVAFMALSPLTGRLADRFAPWRLCAAGMALGSAGCVAYAWTLGAPGLAVAVALLLVLAVVYALFMAANAKQVLESAAVEHRGAASAVFGTFYSLSLLIGVNLFETLYSGTATAAGKAAVPAPDAGWWVSGFSAAYLVGAGACTVALLLCLGVPWLERRLDRRGADEASDGVV